LVPVYVRDFRAFLCSSPFRCFQESVEPHFRTRTVKKGTYEERLVPSVKFSGSALGATKLDELDVSLDLGPGQELETDNEKALRPEIAAENH
jgi:hypothetical protein